MLFSEDTNGIFLKISVSGRRMHNADKGAKLQINF